MESPTAFFEELKKLRVDNSKLIKELALSEKKLESREQELSAEKLSKTKEKEAYDKKIYKLSEADKKMHENIDEYELASKKREEDIGSLETQLAKEKNSLEIVTKKCAQLQKASTSQEELNKILIGKAVSKASDPGVDATTDNCSPDNPNLSKKEHKNIKNRIGTLEDIIRDKENEGRSKR